MVQLWRKAYGSSEVYWENCSDLLCCICSLSLGRWLILLCAFWAAELGTANAQCWFCPAHLTGAIHFAPKQLREVCNNNMYSSKLPGINSYEFSSVVKIDLVKNNENSHTLAKWMAFWMGPLGREKAKPCDITSLFGTQAGVGHCRQIHCQPGLTDSVNGYESITTMSGTAEMYNALVPWTF